MSDISMYVLENENLFYAIMSSCLKVGVWVWMIIQVHRRDINSETFKLLQKKQKRKQANKRKNELKAEKYPWKDLNIGNDFVYIFIYKATPEN